MTPVGVAALILSIAAMGFGWSRLTLPRLALLILLLFTHLAASLYYYTYSLTEIADASAYYNDPFYWGSQPWDLSTKLVTQLCYVLKTRFGASYLDCFLMFQAAGFAGVMILARTFDEIEAGVGIPQRRGYLALLFLPSVNFWTSAIGKDAPMFFAISLCVWAMMKLRRRLVYFGIALAVMVLFRAHVALMAAMAVAGASLFGSSTSLGAKMGFMAVALVGMWFTSGAVQSSFGIDPTDPSSVTAWLDQQNAIFVTMAGTTSLGDAAYPVKVLSLLFRPLFFDAHGVLGIISSLENIGAVVGFLYAAKNWRDLLLLARRVAFMRFVLLFAFILLFSLTLVYYNVGLGLRERVMAYPMIFSILVALLSMRQKRKLAPAAQPADRLMPNVKAHRPLAEL